MTFQIACGCRVERHSMALARECDIHAALRAELTALRERVARLVGAIETEGHALVVEREPDYWSRGHFYEGRRPYIRPSTVLKLSIGTKLYTADTLRAALGEK